MTVSVLHWPCTDERQQAKPRDQLWTKPCAAKVWQKPHIATGQVIPDSQEARDETQRKPSQTVSPFSNTAFGAPSSYSRGQNHSVPTSVWGVTKCCPIALTNILVADTCRKQVHFEAYQAVISWKGRSPTNRNCVCHLAALSFGVSIQKKTPNEFGTNTN